MMKVYETTPNFAALYGDYDGLSSRLSRVYNNADKTGGPFLKTLKYEKVDNVKVPDVRADMDKIKIDVLGFY